MATLCAAVFLVSAAVLALELVLMRILAIASWHHFSYMVISVALLGFGTSGVALTLADRWLRPRWRTVVWLLCLALAAAVPLAHLLAGRIPLNVLELLWDSRQWLWLLLTYLVFLLPFLIGGAAVGLALVANAHRANRLYFFNLLGSGVGAAAAVLLFHGNPPVRLLLVIAATAAVAGLVLVLGRPWWRAALSLAVGAAVLLTFTLLAPLEQPVSQFKELPICLGMAGAEHEATVYGPLGRLDVVGSDAYHAAPGLSLAFAGELPRQKALLTDGHGAAPLSLFHRDADYEYLDYLTSALPYHLLRSPRVCVIGAGPGGDVAQAVHLGAQHTTAVELNPQVVELVRRVAPPLAALYDRRDVSLQIAEARFFLESTTERFDLIQISLLDSLAAASGGLYGLSESHLYTVEAVETALRRLQPGGMLAVTRWLLVPPRDLPKMIATIVEAMNRQGGPPPRERIAVIRSMFTATILAGADSLTPEQRAEVRRFAEDRGFDLVYLADLAPAETNRYHRSLADLPECFYYGPLARGAGVHTKPLSLEGEDGPDTSGPGEGDAGQPDYYYLLARSLIDGDAAATIRGYPCDIQPATDDRPFFFDFFRWWSLPALVSWLGTQWKAFAEWGYLVLVASLVQAVAVGGLLILLPGWLIGRRAGVRGRRRAVALYFALLGFAYIFLEMGFIAKLTLLLGSPVYATAVVLAAFMVASGLGSLSGERWFGSPERAVPRAVVGIAVSAIVVLALLNWGFGLLVRLPLAGRVPVCLAMVGSMAFFMGLPFPNGLRMVDAAARPLVPWAWAVNGFASVVGAVGGTALAMSIGFSALAATAVGLYVLAALVARRLSAVPGPLPS